MKKKDGKGFFFKGDERGAKVGDDAEYLKQTYGVEMNEKKIGFNKGPEYSEETKDLLSDFAKSTEMINKELEKKVVDNDDLSTFSLSVCVTTPYNADFDGDEMNIFIPQSIQTMMELEKIAQVKRQIISPRFSAPLAQSHSPSQWHSVMR